MDATDTFILHRTHTSSISKNVLLCKTVSPGNGKYRRLSSNVMSEIKCWQFLLIKHWITKYIQVVLIIQQETIHWFTKHYGLYLFLIQRKVKIHIIKEFQNSHTRQGNIRIFRWSDHKTGLFCLCILRQSKTSQVKYLQNKFDLEINFSNKITLSLTKYIYLPLHMI